MKELYSAETEACSGTLYQIKEMFERRGVGTKVSSSFQHVKDLIYVSM